MVRPRKDSTISLKRHLPLPRGIRDRNPDRAKLAYLTVLPSSYKNCPTSETPSKNPRALAAEVDSMIFYATTRGTVQHLAIISNGSLDVLKAFIAKGWPPIVMIQFQGRSPEILTLSDYNDQLGEISLQNPTNLAKRRLNYADFETTWSKSSRNKCVLITPQQLTEIDVQNVLGRYLPTEAFQQISVRSR